MAGKRYSSIVADMNAAEPGTVAEIDCKGSNWMIELGKLAAKAESIVLKNFKPTSANIGFIKSLSQDNHLFIRSWDDDLVLETLSA